MDTDRLDQYRTVANVNNIRYQLAQSADNISKCGDFLINYANEIIKIGEDFKKYSKKIEDNIERINNDMKVTDAVVFITAMEKAPSIPALRMHWKDIDIYQTDSLKYLVGYSEKCEKDLKDFIAALNTYNLDGGKSL
jgi:hypothetical protein